jgi:hypothetical protein
MVLTRVFMTKNNKADLPVNHDERSPANLLYAISSLLSSSVAYKK